MAKQPWGGRPDKATLARIKLGTIVASLVAFVGSLDAVAYINPGTGSMTATDNQAQAVQIASGLSSTGASTASTATSAVSSSSSTSSSQQAPSVMPVVRTRGS